MASHWSVLIAMTVSILFTFVSLLVFCETRDLAIENSFGRKGIILSAIVHSCMCNKSLLLSVCFVSFRGIPKSEERAIYRTVNHYIC